ncbi:MAG: terminase small subunit [Bacillota bacterium]|nr:terminase small subunit [Bacillota bacterium]
MTERQLKFCRNYLAGKTEAEAAREAGYTQKNLSATTNRLMQNREIQDYLSRNRASHLESIAGNEEILQYLTAVLRSNDPEVTVRDKMRAAELLGKNLSLFTDSSGSDKPYVLFYGEEKI